jgi:aspartyl-tRNA(Asn)/glutamyl-tRNA(Gln) amidotransferase subunit A
MTELVYEPLHVVTERVRARELSPVEVTEAALARVERDEPRLNAFITQTPELALEQARAAEVEIGQGTYRGPLHGVPICLKDLLTTRGVRTTGGSRVLGEWIPETDATVVTKLREAGAVFVGKTGMPEFANEPTSLNPFYGGVHNPWRLDYDTGGSSSGTGAAIAAGMCWAGPGSDTGGSIRIPSAACGLVGLKPTYGRVSLRGVLPLCATLDHVGPMARTVRDAALLMQALAGFDPQDIFSRDAPADDYVANLEQGVAGLRIALLVDDGGAPFVPEIVEAVRAGVATLERAGASVEEVRLPFLRGVAQETIAPLEQADVALDYGHYLPERAAELSPGFRGFVEAGLALTGAQVMHARRRLNHELAQLERAMRGYDVMVSPTLSTWPPAVGESLGELVRLTTPWDANGWPAITVPVGLGPGNLPIGLQLAARPWQEALLLRAARVVEQEHALAWPAAGLRVS